jgi:HPt (histidine-containing phosphotransfer) domain-containing protein
MAEVFDKDAALERVDNDIDLLKELVDICSTEYASKIKDLRTAMQSGDSKTVSEIAHSLKSAFGNVGAMVGHKTAFDLEQAGRKGSSSDLPTLVSSFERAVGEFFLTFNEEKEKLKG